MMAIATLSVLNVPSIRSLPIACWPEDDRRQWEAACRPSHRLHRGGAAGHLKQATRDDLAQRYGYFLDYIDRCGELDPAASAAAYVTLERVGAYLADLRARQLSSVTIHGSIYKLRRTAEILAPTHDFAWLREIEKDLDLDKQPAPKHARIVDSDRIVAAALTLMEEAETASHRSELVRALAYRNGLMIALLALHPIRIGTFANLELGTTFRREGKDWWIVLPGEQTKSGRPDQRRVNRLLAQAVDRYVDHHCFALGAQGNRLWIGCGGRPLSYAAFWRIVTATTRETLGIPINPHLFRSCGASTSYLYAGDQPHLAAGLLQHTDPAVTESHYNRTSSASYARKFSALIEGS